ncbi:MAG: MurR/RpiR family transcriptional regulator [Armatimonadota bacterium]|nr:MurR/RpiR family transcriptional regulator [Armatimonadota bacterium]
MCPPTALGKLQSGSFIKIREIAESLTDAERRVARYILRHPHEIPQISITELSERARVSEATVVRLCKRVGLRGYQDLRIRLALDLSNQTFRIHEEIDPSDHLDAISQKLLHRATQTLQDTIQVLDREALQRAVDRICEARRIDLYGVGASGVVALDAEQKFLRIGLQARAFIDPHLQATSAALLTPQDVAIGISHSGSTKDTVNALAIAQRNRAYTIAITQYAPSPITKFADTVLHTVAHEPLLREAAIESRLAALFVIDIVFVAVVMRLAPQTVRRLAQTRNAVLDRKF